jgi:GT2 family glycosyltransferase
VSTQPHAAPSLAPGTEGPPVTVVVATRNRWSDLQRSLPRHEGPVILVDNASDDGTPALVRMHFPEVRVVELPVNRGAVARNLGVLLARTPYVAFADDDSWWAPGSLAAVAACFDAAPRLALLAGHVLVGEEQKEDPTSAAMAASPLGHDEDLPGPSILGFLACGAVVRRRAFLDAGGFDDIVFFRGEEQRLALDLRTRGWGLAYVSSVVAHHHPSPQREPSAGAALAARNDILTAVMRRPWPVVASTVVGALELGRPGRVGLARAVVRSPRALRHRRRVPRPVEEARRLLDSPR